jgi:uncharacterized protein (DUF2147 family)
MRFILATAIALVVGPPALASDVLGEWMRADGKTKVRFVPCGDTICGVISWLRDVGGGATVGERVFSDMRPSDARVWVGKAFSPEDGREYAGKVALDGNRLMTSGCAFGGLICKNFEWTRVE